ncbi:MAG: 3-dehydroquinate synthase, partial [Micromonosporaceae bacterium]
HALDVLHPGLASHGEQVGLGALFCTYLRGDEARFAQLSAALGRHGLARVPGDLRLSDEDFVAAVHHAPATRPDRYTILEHLDLSIDQILTRLGEYLHAVGD